MANYKSLYFSNRKEYYRRKKISIALKKYYSNKKIVKAQIEEKGEPEIKVYRQTVAYVFYGNGYQITYRASIYTQKPTINQEKRLKSYLEKRIKSELDDWEYIGFEQEPMGDNDLKGIILNKLYFEVDK